MGEEAGDPINARVACATTRRDSAARGGGDAADRGVFGMKRNPRGVREGMRHRRGGGRLEGARLMNKAARTAGGDPVICPTGCLLIRVSSRLFKNISVPRLVESNLQPSPSPPTEGRIAIVTDAGR